MKFHLAIYSLLGFLAMVSGPGQSWADTPSVPGQPECVDRPLRARVLAEWSQALDQMRIVKSDFDHIQQLPVKSRFRPKLGEVCFDIGTMFHRVMSAIGKTGALEEGSQNADVRALMGSIRGRTVDIADFCMAEASLNWETEVPEMQVDLQTLMTARDRIVLALTPKPLD